MNIFAVKSPIKSFFLFKEVKISGRQSYEGSNKNNGYLTVSVCALVALAALVSANYD
jgi:hypothetical protein